MCWAEAIPVALAGAQAIGGQISGAQAAKAQNEANRLQAINAIRQANWNNADLTLQQRDALDVATQELTAKNMAQVQALGTVRAAIGESMIGGRSMERIERVTRGEHIRNANMVTENYRRDYASMFAQQVGNTESAKAQVNELNRTMTKGKSALTQALEVALPTGAAFGTAYLSGGFDKDKMLFGGGSKGGKK
ncbi:internal virion protein [Morganella phage vB_MmoP_MP2]|uniref:Internal virion protein gp14 n=1 Tax=Morganella phage vB_MmoP_MP2 TaxID=1852627 RepID=A0A192YBX9_9CAUD|nr:internal virion protein [Morganella phage vB_MmoP_MP2]ANM46356.1 internal virion protein B [Morganella phage vB_MmoP_MP2]